MPSQHQIEAIECSIMASHSKKMAIEYKKMPSQYQIEAIECSIMPSHNQIMATPFAIMGFDSAIMPANNEKKKTIG